MTSYKKHFPSLADSSVAYLDNAATTQMPAVVMDAMANYERGGRGNPHRGLHAFAEKATLELERARKVVARFVGASSDQLIFTKSTTEGLNLAINSFTRGLSPGDEVVYTIFDHHATLLPLYERSKELGFTLRIVPVTEAGELDMKIARELITDKTKLIVAAHVSNVLGTVLPIRELGEMAREAGAEFIVDGAQAVGHRRVDVTSLGCDTYVFGAHKMYGPMGVGALILSEPRSPSDGRTPNLEPLLYGGGMVEEVGGSTEAFDVRYLDDYRLFEAGTPNVTGAIGFAAACEFLEGIGMGEVEEHEKEIGKYLREELEKVSGIRVWSTFLPSYGGARGGLVSFVVDGMHPHDVAQALADKGVYVRAGLHCAAPLSRLLNEAGTVRASIGLGTDKGDIDRLVEVLRSYLS